MYMLKLPKHRVLSFKYALEGIFSALKTEPNLKFHFLAGAIVILLGWFFLISILEWIIVITMMGLVISLELTNTAIEAVVDYLIPNIHPVAKKVKDISAGAVLIASISALIIGLLVFLPYITPFFIK